MDEEKYLLSYGAGVNSTAILALIKLGRLEYPNLKILMCDTGAERPATYCYLKMIKKKFPIEIIRSKHGSIIEYCRETGHLPTGLVRWCTGEFKIAPIKKWEKENDWKDSTTIMGIAFDEKHRAKKNNSHYDKVVYPLIELELTREDCKTVIKEAGWEVPSKSGCFICPFQRKSEWIAMQHNQPLLFDTVVDLEENSKYTFKKDKTLKEWLEDEKDQSRLVPFEDYLHCLCRYD